MRFSTEFLDCLLLPEPTVFGNLGAGIWTQAAALHSLSFQMVEGLCRWTLEIALVRFWSQVGISSAVMQISEESWENYGKCVGKNMRAEGVKAKQLITGK